MNMLEDSHCYRELFLKHIIAFEDAIDRRACYGIYIIARLQAKVKRPRMEDAMVGGLEGEGCFSG